MSPNHHERIQEAILTSSGDILRSDTSGCGPILAVIERELTAAFNREGVRVKRAFSAERWSGQGVAPSERIEEDVLTGIDSQANLVVIATGSRCAHLVVSALRSHRGAILTVANWPGELPGISELLNLNGSLARAGIPFSTLWSRDFQDERFRSGLRAWIEQKEVIYNMSRVRDLNLGELPPAAIELGTHLAATFNERKVTLGIFDGSYRDVNDGRIDDEVLSPSGVYTQHLNLSSLVTRMRTVSNSDAFTVWQWLDERGLVFASGSDETYELTSAQILTQCKMYIAAVRIAHEFGWDVISIQSGNGWKDLVAPGFIGGLLNSAERPPVYGERSGQELFAGEPLPHLSHADDCAGLDALVTIRSWRSLKLDPTNALYDLCWPEHCRREGFEDFVWALQIPVAAPANHLIDGYAGASSDRAPRWYSPLGGGTLNGIVKPGEIVWSRLFAERGIVHADIGTGRMLTLSPHETERQWKNAATHWPLVSAIFHGISVDTFIAGHCATQVNIAYAADALSAVRALAVKAATLHARGVVVHLCGEVTLDEGMQTTNMFPQHFAQPNQGSGMGSSQTC